MVTQSELGSKPRPAGFSSCALSMSRGRGQETKAQDKGAEAARLGESVGGIRSLCRVRGPRRAAAKRAWMGTHDRAAPCSERRSHCSGATLGPRTAPRGAVGKLPGHTACWGWTQIPGHWAGPGFLRGPSWHFGDKSLGRVGWHLLHGPHFWPVLT